MKIEIKRILEYLYLGIIISIFFKIKLYPIIMLLFIFLTIYDYKSKYSIKIIKENVYIFLFFILSISNFIFFNKNIENIKQLLKLIINIGFLFTFSMNKLSFIEDKNIEKIMKIIKFLVIGTFLQILLLYFIKEINIFSFFNIQGSREAYIINFEDVPFLLGNTNKNIWSTKIIFLEIILLTYWYKKEKINYFYLVLVLFNCILLLSRTGYLALLVYFSCLFFCNLLKKVKEEKKRKLFIIIIIVVSFIMLNIIFEKFIRIDFSSFKEEYLKRQNDGGVSRIKNWLIFFKYYLQESPLLGIGLGNTQKFLLKYNGFPDTHMHNFLLNCFLEQGVVIGVVYMLFHFDFIKKVVKNLKMESIILLLPFYIIISLQYSGYDNDIVVYMTLVYVLIKNLKNYKLLK